MTIILYNISELILRDDKLNHFNTYKYKIDESVEKNYSNSKLTNSFKTI